MQLKMEITRMDNDSEILFARLDGIRKTKLLLLARESRYKILVY